MVRGTDGGDELRGAEDCKEQERRESTEAIRGVRGNSEEREERRRRFREWKKCRGGIGEEVTGGVFWGENEGEK